MAYRFTRAIARRPGDSVANGLREGGGTGPDPNLFRAQHKAYVAALKNAGLAVEVLEAREDLPDSVFVEDTALCLTDAVVLLRPGAASRLAETAAITPALDDRFGRVGRIEAPASIDGGDILVTPREVLVGRSARTGDAGIEQLAEILRGWGRDLRAVDTPEGVLHFKTDCALLDDDTVLATGRLAASGCFGGYRVLTVPRGEEPAANAIRVNDVVLLAAGYTRTAELLNGAGYSVVTLDVSEAAKVDGGLSCMSLRF